MIKKILFSLAGIFLFLLGLECALRVGGAFYLRFNYSLNSTVDSTRKEYAILCLGDSFTLGIGAEKGGSYPEQLEALLNKNPGWINKFKVYREFRINSSSLLTHLKQDLKDYAPNLVIIMIGCNDRWSLDNCRYWAIKNGGLLARVDVTLHRLRVYKLMRITLLNLGSLLGDSFRNTNDIYFTYRFNNSKALEHFQAGQDYLSIGECDLALRELKAAEQLEPGQVLINFRLATLYSNCFRDENLAKHYALRALYYGDSQIVGHVFLFCYIFDDKYTEVNKKTVAKMEEIIFTRYHGSDKEKALRYLRNLYLANTNARVVVDVLGYNLGEILSILKERNIKVILMDYPMSIRSDLDKVIEKKAGLFKAPLVYNKEIFEEKMRCGSLKKEDLFVTDGHCNTRGYGLVAENLYSVLVNEKVIENAKTN